MERTPEEVLQDLRRMFRSADRRHPRPVNVVHDPLVFYFNGRGGLLAGPYFDYGDEVPAESQGWHCLVFKAVQPYDFHKCLEVAQDHGPYAAAEWADKHCQRIVADRKE